MVDRTQHWVQCLDAACASLGLTEEEARQQKQALLLKPARERTKFASVAEDVSRSIQELREFIATNKRDYLASGKMSEQAKDQVEEQVGLLVRTVTQSLEALKNGVVAAQQPQGGGRPLVNEQTAAHLHGSVLVLAEQLQRVAAGFDKCRAVRYQASLARDLRHHHKPPSAARNQLPPDEHASSSGGGEPSDGPQQAQQYDSTTQQLLAQLRASGQQAQQIESSMRHVSTLNQMISTAVMQQADLIEQLYNNALEATQHLQRGNRELQKTIEVNRSSRYWVATLIVVAALLLLLFDWIA